MYGVILAGGGGTRLWPLSRARAPKPLLPLLPGGRSILELTEARLRPLIPPERLFISTSAAYAAACCRLLPDLPPENVIIEPDGRDTAPAIGLAASRIARLDPAAVMGVFPADHIVRDEDGFRANLRLAEQVAAQEYLVTLGMKPTYPETGYGYVEVAGPVPGLGDDGRALEVARFVEKPALELAHEYVAGGRHLWNAGVFVWRVETILDRFAAALPEQPSVHARQRHEIGARLATIGAGVGTAEAESVLEREWAGMPKISIDFAVMQEAPHVATIPSDVGWSDAGDWNAIGTQLGDVVTGYTSAGAEHLLVSGGHCVVVAPRGKLVATLGVEDLVIVDTPDALLVCPRSRAQEVKRIVDTLKELGRGDLL